jgi:hypothetical protein
MIFCTLLAKIFVIILRTLFRSEIGLKSFGEVGESTFGIRVMNEESILLREKIHHKNPRLVE